MTAMQTSIHNVYATTFQRNEWIQKPDPEILRAIGAANCTNQTQNLDWSPARTNKKDGLTPVTPTYVDSLILRHLVESRHIEGGIYRHLSPLVKELTSLLREYAPEDTSERFLFAGLEQRVDVKTVGMARALPVEIAGIPTTDLESRVFMYERTDDLQDQALHWVNIKLGCPNASLEFVLSFLRSAAVKASGFTLKDIDITQDLAGTLDYAALASHLQLDRMKTPATENDVTEKPLLSPPHPTCIQFYHNVDGFLCRTKLYMTLARHIESASVRSKVGHRICEWILAPESTRLGQVRAATEWTGTTKAETTIACDKGLKFEALPLSTGSKLLASPNAWFEGIPAMTHSIIPTECVYTTPHFESVNAWLISLNHQLLVVDLESDTALFVNSYNATTDKLSGTSFSDWSQNEASIKKHYAFGKLPLDVVELNKKRSETDSKQRIPAWVKDLPSFQCNARGTHFAHPISAEHDDPGGLEAGFEIKATEEQRDEPLDDGVEICAPTAETLSSLPHPSGASVVSLALSRNDHVYPGWCHTYVYRLARFRRPIWDGQETGFDPATVELPLPRTRLHVPPHHAYYSEMRRLSREAQVARTKQAGFGSCSRFEFEFDKQAEDSNHVYTTRDVERRPLISFAAIKFSKDLQVLREYDAYFRACRESNSARVSRPIWMRERLHSLQCKRREWTHCMDLESVWTRETDEAHLREDMLVDDFRGFLQRHARTGGSHDIEHLPSGEYELVAVWRHHDAKTKPELYAYMYPSSVVKHTLFLRRNDDETGETESKLICVHAHYDLNEALSVTNDLDFQTVPWDTLPLRHGIFAFDRKRPSQTTSVVGMLWKTSDASNKRQRVKGNAGGPATRVEVAMRVQIGKTVAYESAPLLAAERRRKVPTTTDPAAGAVIPLYDATYEDVDFLQPFHEIFRPGDYPQGVTLKIEQVAEITHRRFKSISHIIVRARAIDGDYKDKRTHDFIASPKLCHLLKSLQVPINAIPSTKNTILCSNMRRHGGFFSFAASDYDWATPNTRQFNAFSKKIASRSIDGQPSKAIIWIRSVKVCKGRDNLPKWVFQSTDGQFFRLKDDNWWRSVNKDGPFRNEPGYGIDVGRWRCLAPGEDPGSAATA